MTASLREAVTTALVSGEVEGGDGLVNRLVPLVYEELRAMAHALLAGERGDHTLGTTALVHEAYLKLVDEARVAERGRSYFFAAAARAMRQVLIDYARRRGRVKRGGGEAPVSLDVTVIAVDALAGELID